MGLAFCQSLFDLVVVLQTPSACDIHYLHISEYKSLLLSVHLINKHTVSLGVICMTPASCMFDSHPANNILVIHLTLMPWS